uniref:Uncharacterized protein n=1 Tax=Phaeomonas parva TaxID=124430 RepID=A0A7S1XJT2_9STRA|mmetsp:Transcript_14709/g.44195  ORF Transcript_14709/g.44195 Transcript_14709/m.44195 type:complete len:671 (+) Transcript_14709:290-2302(+)|eukprot:CAMPEP_0118863690 /NCGR_PEP_ID=MMETSP1163-20130328/8458_1 /TAXON_ID=124430 /ORGANISM="Phaeomonas parva, Strain CCMP2877" /LENGTH=670 /DNA_ID=CAMNT_0006797719 /DNA_START=178 /DNA_END=2190 /DNA_ORIENTATION=+
MPKRAKASPKRALSLVQLLREDEATFLTFEEFQHEFLRRMQTPEYQEIMSQKVAALLEFSEAFQERTLIDNGRSNNSYRIAEELKEKYKHQRFPRLTQTIEDEISHISNDDASARAGRPMKSSRRQAIESMIGNTTVNTRVTSQRSEHIELDRRILSLLNDDAEREAFEKAVKERKSQRYRGSLDEHKKRDEVWFAKNARATLAREWALKRMEVRKDVEARRRQILDAELAYTLDMANGTRREQMARKRIAKARRLLRSKCWLSLLYHHKLLQATQKRFRNNLERAAVLRVRNAAALRIQQAFRKSREPTAGAKMRQAIPKSRRSFKNNAPQRQQTVMMKRSAETVIFFLQDFRRAAMPIVMRNFRRSVIKVQRYFREHLMLAKCRLNLLNLYWDQVETQRTDEALEALQEETRQLKAEARAEVEMVSHFSKGSRKKQQMEIEKRVEQTLAMLDLRARIETERIYARRASAQVKKRIIEDKLWECKRVFKANADARRRLIMARRTEASQVSVGDVRDFLTGSKASMAPQRTGVHIDTLHGCAKAKAMLKMDGHLLLLRLVTRPVMINLIEQGEAEQRRINQLRRMRKPKKGARTSSRDKVRRHTISQNSSKSSAKDLLGPTQAGDASAGGREVLDRMLTPERPALPKPSSLRRVPTRDEILERRQSMTNA